MAAAVVGDEGGEERRIRWRRRRISGDARDGAVAASATASAARATEQMSRAERK
jgi:hypothetical protein